MQKVIFAALLLSALTGSAQRIEYDKIDKFKGTRYVSTTQVPLAKILGLPKIMVSASKLINQEEDSASKFIVLTFWFKASTVFSLSSENSCLLKFDNGEVLQLPYIGSYKIYTTDGHCYFTTAADEDQVKVIKANKLTDVRIETSKYSTDIGVKEKFQSKLAETIQVLQDHLNKK